MNLKAKTVTDLESKELSCLLYIKNEASIVETKKVESFERQFSDHFKSMLVVLLILL